MTQREISVELFRTMGNFKFYVPKRRYRYYSHELSLLVIAENSSENIDEIQRVMTL
jgi:hypothetical protein